MATDNIYGYTGNLKLPNQSIVTTPKKEKQISTNTFGYTGNLKLPTSPAVDEPSAFEKFKYGMGKELTFFGELYDLSRAFYNSYGPMTFEDARQDIKEQRQKELEERFTWAKNKAYESDSAVMAGQIAQTLLDPFYILMPWGRAAQAGKLIGKGGAALAGLGAGVGATDISVRSLANTGEVKLQDVALGAGLGAGLSPVAMGVQKGLGVAANKLFPNLFKNKQMQDAVNDQLRNNYKTKYNLNDKQLDNVYKISSIKSIQTLTSQVDNNYKLFVKPLQELQDALAGVTTKFTTSTPLNPNKLVNIIKQIPNGLDLKFKSLGNKTLSTVKNKKELDAIKKELTNEVNTLIDKQIKKSNRLNTKLQIEITKELHKAGGLTSAAARAITSIAVRPTVGAGGGAVFATLGDVDDESFAAMVAGGAALGGLHRHLMRGGIKSIPLPKQISFAKSIKTNYFNNLGRNLRIITSATQQSKLTSRGPVLDEFSNQMFYRPTDTVRLDWLGRVAKNQDESIGLVGTGTSVEERMEQSMSVWATKIVKDVLADADGETQKLAIQIVRGKKGVTNANAKALAKRIKTYLGEFRDYYKEVGFTEKELLKNYFPRKFDFKLINENQDDFVNRVAKAYVNIGKAKDLSEGKRLAGIYISNLEGNYTKEIFDEDTLLKIYKGEKVDANLPISQHIEFERSLQSKKGVYAEVEELLEPYLVNDVGTVLMDLARTSVKSVEFARTFGNRGQLLSSYLRRLARQYEENGFTLRGNYYEGGQHKADVDALRHAVNSYFGRYGRRGTDTERSIGAILSTLANFNMMDKVTIANLGDLIQPFQNSRFFLSAIKGMGQSASSDMAIKENKVIRAAIRNAYTTPDGGSSPFLNDSGTGNVMNFIGKSNEFFFKAIGLEAITGLARRYAYNVGAVDAHKSAQRLVRRFQQSGVKSLDDLKDAASLADISHLQKVGAIRFDSNRKILNSKDIIDFGVARNLNEAGKKESVRSMIQTVGNAAANRDAIIPQVGNRLLFTQTRNPLVRIMAKSAQTNAMISRIEDGNLKQAITMLSALSIFGAVKNLRDFARTGEFEMNREIEKEPGKWLAFSTQMSGNLGWLPTTINNSILTTYGSTPVEFFPAVSIFNEFGEAFRDTTGAFLDKNSYDDALKSWLEFAPAPTVRSILDRAGVPFMVYKKDTNMLDAYNKSNIFKGTSLFNKGGFVNQVRKLFSKGDVVEQTVEPTEYQYDLKQEPETENVYDKKELNTLVTEGPKIVPKKKPIFKTNSIGSSVGPVGQPLEGITQKDGLYYINNPLFDKMLEKESNRGRYLKSKKGAVGLMQIMPNTAKDPGYQVTPLTVEELNDPVKNVKFAKEYYNAMKKEFGSDRLALIAYNWGVGNTKKWLASGGNEENLPKETRDYINFIVGDRENFNVGGLARAIQRGLTQVTNTAKSYEKVNKIFDDFKVKSVHDFGSGLGVGTKKFTNKKVTSHEPFADLKKIEKVKGRKPDYIDVEDMIMGEGVKSKDGVINHMVLNVIEDKTERDIVVKQIANLLNDKGVGVITTRTAQDVASASTKKPYLDGFLIKKGKEFTFQKGFSQSELKNYISEVLGDLFDVIDVPKKYNLGGSGVIITRKNRQQFHSGGMAHTHGPKKPKTPSSWKSLFTSNQAYSGSSSSSNSSSNNNNDKDNKGQYLASTQGGTNTGGTGQSGGAVGSGINMSNNTTSSTIPTNTSSTGSGDSSTKKSSKDKVKKLLKETRNKIERFATEKADILPGGETYEKAVDIAYGGLKFGKGYSIGEVTGGTGYDTLDSGRFSVYGKTGGILKGDTTTTIGTFGDVKTYPTEVPDIKPSNILDDSAVGAAAGVNTKYGFFTGSVDTKQGATLGYDVTGGTKFFEPSILGKKTSIGVTPYASATYKPLDKGDNFDAQVGATVTTPIGSADVFITDEGKVGISIPFKKGGLLDKKRG